MRLQLEMPFGHETARRYAADAVSVMLGVEWHLTLSDRSDISISLSGSPITLIMPDRFFGFWKDETPVAELLPASRPVTWTPPLDDLDLVTASVPVLFGDRLDKAADECFLPLDIFGSAFFMLSRFEEVARPVEDIHQRFPASASLAASAGFLERPLLDEYVEILWAYMHRLWPAAERQVRRGSTRVSCDVDTPFDPTIRSLGVLSRTLAGDLLRRRSPIEAAKRTRRYLDRLAGQHSRDPFHTFDWYVDICERAGLKAAFYFISDRTNPAFDAVYDIDSKPITTLMAWLHDAGHEIGTHGSFETFRNGAQILREKTMMVAAAASTGRDIVINGNRQHYLRWDVRQTPDYLDAAGYLYDTTGGYADRPGFRFGTAKPFKMWSWTRHTSLPLLQYPLIVMEASVIDDSYLGLDHSPEGLDLIMTMKRRALRFGGDFSLLWHNSHLMTAEDRDLFSTIVLSP